jgi:ribonucleoside-triphosphate reductase
LKPSQEFTYVRTYSRWLDELGRRETYPESATRAMDFFQEELGAGVVTPHFYKLGKQSLLNMDALCSMRTMWAAGKAAKANNITMYNCSFVAMNDIRAFPEILYVLLCGTGVGFSIESEYVNKLPQLKPTTGKDIDIQVADSKEGWAEALLKAMEALWEGHNPRIDYSKVRPRGSRLMTMGGRSAGPEPLKNLFDFIIKAFQQKRQKNQYKLTPLDILDINNKIAEIVVVGGVRRSSQISLSDLNDSQIAQAKVGEFWNQFPQRRMSNNSTAYNYKPDVVTFMEEIGSLIRSGSGERGIFNREGALKQILSSGRRTVKPHEGAELYIIGTNPCGEILLRDMEFCNLSEVVVRENDDLESLRLKVKSATMFGAWQAIFTNFHFLRPQWKQNCNEERLLGVSLTGIMDNPVLNNTNDKMKKWLAELKSVAVSECEKWCKRLDINMSAAITCVKPSGTVSQLTDCSSGIHPRYANYYIRRYRISVVDPLFKMLKDQGVPYHSEVGEDAVNPSTMVLDFPINSPLKGKTRHDYTALQQLEHWKVVKEFWCEHNPSITVQVDDSEWLDVAAWCYKNFDELCGVSFLPKDSGVYQLAPYEEIDNKTYDKLVNDFPKIDYSQLSKYENDDNTEGAKVYSCVGDKCEI